MTIEKILFDIKIKKPKRVILDTDTYNEMDDQFALAYALGCDSFSLVSVNSAPFENDRCANFNDGMLKSYDEIHRVLEKCSRLGTLPVMRGSENRIASYDDPLPEDSPAARYIVGAALESKEPLYILATGAITNVVSAILTEPSIKDKICVIWLGTNHFDYGNQNEFNLVQDVAAARLLLDLEVPLVLLPALGDNCLGTKELLVKKEELSLIKGDGECQKFFREELPGEFGAKDDPYWKRIIWDLAAPALLSVPEAFNLDIIPAPVLTKDKALKKEAARHRIIYMSSLDKNAIIKDAFEKISSL